MSAKDRHYWAQLRLALTSGQWSSQCPAKTPTGMVLPWSELLRKFNKHCKGFQDVAQIASHTQALALLLAANSQDEDQNDAPEERESEYPVKLGSECILPEERVEEARANYDALTSLKSSNYDSLNFALAYYAYALGNPAQCLLHLSDIPELLNLQNHIPTDSTSTTTAHAHHIGLHVPSFSTSRSFSSVGGSFVTLTDSSTPEIRDGRSWAMTESLRSVCLQGMSHEKLSPSNPQVALNAYGTALPLLESLGNMLSDQTSAASTPTLATNSKVFTHQRELWRWVERLLWRAIVVSATIAGPTTTCEDVWTWFHHYSACSIHWPATFCTWHRSTISALHLRAVILRHHPIHASQPILPTVGSEEKQWLHTARTVVNDYRAILDACTSFPRAGERNVRVEDFVDLCVGVWEADGADSEDAGWVIDILWWATRLTFNSPKVLRHLTLILHATGDTSLARRTLLLYSQVVGKAYETKQANTATPLSSTGNFNDSDIDNADSDSVSDKEWVEMLIYGARMLCRWATSQTGLEGLREAREAGVCIERARTRLRIVGIDGIRLAARVDLAEGVWNFVMALKEQDTHTRPARLAAAHKFFVQACSPTSLDPEEASKFTPDPAALYHLALSFAHPGPDHNLEQAILHAGRAAEAEPREIRYWHLFGLLLAAAEKWTEARQMLELGAAIGENEPAEDVTEDGAEDGEIYEQTSRVSDPEENLEVPEKDFPVSAKAIGTDTGPEVVDIPLANRHATPTTVPSVQIPLIDGTRISPAGALLAPVQDHPPPSKEDLFEYALQLRMTQGVLTEVIAGAEGAEQKWLEVFTWVAAQQTSTVDQNTPRRSVDDGAATTGRSPFISVPTDDSAAPYSPTHESHEKQDTPEPIPIIAASTTPDSEAPQHQTGKPSPTKRSSSFDRDTSKGKKMQQMIKYRMHQGRARVSTISRKIKTGSLKKANSTPDFHAILRQTSYQASSIHSRRRLSSFLHNPNDRTPTVSPPPLPVPPSAPPQDRKRNLRVAHRERLIADLWLMSAATFRRLGKIDQAKGAIQEAEVKDEGNPRVWVQLGLYYITQDQQEHAIDAYQKALFINPDDVSASVHLARLFLARHETQAELSTSTGTSNDVDLTAGLLSHLTRGNGWHVPEAWYYLAKAYGLQGRKKRERECLDFALLLSASRGIREIGTAVGWCI
ncbi:hypothetical protein C0989_008017 [Termitomyces sp. Mn162]|nr:hypothetical protein C0989_008017 [Termitomyces sp. Mn162]